MASNELRARLVGHAMPWGEEMVFSNRENGKHKSWMESPMPYDSDRNACAELINYLWHHQGHNAVPRFFHEFTKAIGCARDDAFAMLRATPDQICAAFDATFAQELAELEKTDAK